MGRNGAGKSTTIKAIMGTATPIGSVCFKGEEMVGLKPHETARRGLGYVPETRDIFPALTVRQNLMLGEKGGKTRGRWSMADMFKMMSRDGGKGMAKMAAMMGGMPGMPPGGLGGGGGGMGGGALPPGMGLPPGMSGPDLDKLKALGAGKPPASGGGGLPGLGGFPGFKKK